MYENLSDKQKKFIDELNNTPTKPFKYLVTRKEGESFEDWVIRTNYKSNWMNNMTQEDKPETD